VLSGQLDETQSRGAKEKHRCVRHTLQRADVSVALKFLQNRYPAQTVTLKMPLC
jgi:hypothetical protein